LSVAGNRAPQARGLSAVSGLTARVAVRAAFSDWQPHVLICDIALPDQDGCSFLEAIRSAGHALPALALTVLGRPEEQARIIDAGFEVFRQKPVDPIDLAHDVARLAVRGRAAFP
jgi:CheY-like chemotaxis protein